MPFDFASRTRSVSTLAGALLAIGAIGAIGATPGFAQTIVQGEGATHTMIVINGQAIDTPTIVASGPETSETRTLEAFRSISVSVPAIATFTVGDKPSVKITTQANIMPVVITRVEAGRLTIGIKGSVSLKQPIHLDIVGPSPDAVAISGTGHFTANALSSDALALNITGQATMEATGEVKHVSVSVSGAGTVDTSAIHARSLDARVSGTATMHAFASEAVRVELSGIGNIHIAGQPAQRTVDRSGLGTVSFD